MIFKYQLKDLFLTQSREEMLSFRMIGRETGVSEIPVRKIPEVRVTGNVQ